MKGLGEQIRRARKERGVRACDLGERLGVSPTAISLWENDKRTPSLGHLVAICKVLDVSADRLLGLQDE